jgi:FkbM family methyltransferase
MEFHSQIGQDRWVDSVLNGKQAGYFVELGACDGLYLSNTLFFERQRGWKGLCIEPNDMYFEKLKNNRNCSISNSLIFSESGKIVDFEMSDAVSGIINENTGPFTGKKNIVQKTTETLGALLEKFNFPTTIDYLSLDVEGQELEILQTFPFDKFKFRCITVEHNEPHVGPAMRMKIRELLEKNGYIFVKGNDDVNNWGHGPIDDFYVNNLI